MICFPTAKINLGLQVLQRRKDGFHDISTIMYPVPLHDALEVCCVSSETIIKIFNDTENIPLKSNLVYKAWDLLSQASDISPVLFNLVKNIPSQAGLGGGSSDAAFALKLLNNYFKLNLDDEILCKYAAKLGSDCAFFIKAEPSLAEGRGEKLTPISLNLSGLYIAIAKPILISGESRGVSTAEAYSLIKPESNRISLCEVVQKPISEWRTLLENDFQKPISNKFPEIERLISDLYDAGAIYAAMSGSGSACFGLFESKISSINTYSKCFLQIAHL